MKKRILLVVLISVLTAALLIGCERGGGDSALVGRWRRGEHTIELMRDGTGVFHSNRERTRREWLETDFSWRADDGRLNLSDVMLERVVEVRFITLGDMEIIVSTPMRNLVYRQYERQSDGYLYGHWQGFQSSLELFADGTGNITDRFGSMQFTWIIGEELSETPHWGSQGVYRANELIFTSPSNNEVTDYAITDDGLRIFGGGFLSGNWTRLGSN